MKMCEAPWSAAARRRLGITVWTGETRKRRRAGALQGASHTAIKGSKPDAHEEQAQEPPSVTSWITMRRGREIFPLAKVSKASARAQIHADIDRELITCSWSRISISISFTPQLLAAIQTGIWVVLLAFGLDLSRGSCLLGNRFPGTNNSGILFD